MSRNSKSGLLCRSAQRLSASLPLVQVHRIENELVLQEVSIAERECNTRSSLSTSATEIMGYVCARVDFSGMVRKAGVDMFHSLEEIAEPLQYNGTRGCLHNRNIGSSNMFDCRVVRSCNSEE